MQLPPLVVDALVHVPEVQQVVEHVVAGDDPAFGPDIPVKGGGGLRPAQFQICSEEGAAVEHGPPPELQLLPDEVQDGGLAAAVSPAQDGHRLKFQNGDLPVQKDAEGVAAAIAGALVFPIISQEMDLSPLRRQGKPPEVPHLSFLLL